MRLVERIVHLAGVEIRDDQPRAGFRLVDQLVGARSGGQACRSAVAGSRSRVAHCGGVATSTSPIGASPRSRFGHRRTRPRRVGQATRRSAGLLPSRTPWPHERGSNQEPLRSRSSPLAARRVGPEANSPQTNSPGKERVGDERREPEAAGVTVRGGEPGIDLHRSRQRRVLGGGLRERVEGADPRGALGDLAGKNQSSGISVPESSRPGPLSGRCSFRPASRAAKRPIWSLNVFRPRRSGRADWPRSSPSGGPVGIARADHGQQGPSALLMRGDTVVAEARRAASRSSTSRASRRDRRLVGQPLCAFAEPVAIGGQGFLREEIRGSASRQTRPPGSRDEPSRRCLGNRRARRHAQRRIGSPC